MLASNDKIRRGDKMENEEVIKPLCRTFIGMQKVRTGFQHRIQKFEERDPPEEVIQLLQTHLKRVRSDEDAIKKDAIKLMKGSALIRFTERVKGLSGLFAFEFLGYIDVNKPSSGCARAYCGLVPGIKRTAGEQSRVNWMMKGKMWFAANSVLMKRDDYYYSLFSAKKMYLLYRRGFARFIENPELCPKYEECVARLKKAKRPACRKHADMMARKWLSSLLVSHMWEVCRVERDLPVNKHTFHIPPKPEDEAHVADILTVAVPVLREGIVPSIDLSDTRVAAEAADIYIDRGIDGLIERYGVKTEWNR